MVKMFPRSILVLLSVSLSIDSEIILQNYKPLGELAKFSAKVYHKFCPEGKTTLLIHNAFDLTPDYFMRILGTSYFNMSLYTFNLKLNTTTGGYYDGIRADLIIIFINHKSVHGLNVFLNVIVKIPSFNTFSKLLIVQTGPVKAGEWISKTFQFLWKYKIMRVFIVFWDETLKIFTFNPFLSDYSIDASTWSDKSLNTKLEFELLDLYGYPMKVFLWDHSSYKDRVQRSYHPDGTVDYFGYDGKLLTQVRNILNVTLEIITESETHILARYNERTNNSSIFSLGDRFMRKHNIDMLFTAIRARPTGDADNLFLHERDDYVIIVPKGSRLPEYLNIVMTVPFKIQLYAAFIMWVSIFLLYCIRKYYKCNNNTFSEVSFDVFRHSFLLPIPRYNDNAPERILLNSLMIFFMIFISVLNSSMVSSLVVTKFIPDLNTIDDLVKTNLTIWITSYELNLVSGYLQGNDRRLLKNLKELPTYSLQSMLSYQNNSGFLTRFEKAREFLKVTKKYGKVRYHIMNEHPVPNAQSYLLPKGHPYQEEIQWIIHKVHESGLYYEWRKTNYGKENISVAADVETTFDDPSKMLRLVHLQTIFYLHLFLLMVSFIVLLIERAVKKYKNTKRNQR